MNSRFYRGAVLGLGLALAGQAAARAQSVRGQGLGDGRGIDHVASLVRAENFDDAASVLTDQLGFSATPALVSPAGAKNRLIWFDDLSYLEVATFTQDNELTAPFLAFLEEHEGAKFYGSDVVDYARAIAFLNRAGYPHVGPIPAAPLTIESTGDVVGLIPLWQSIILTSKVAPDNSTFFLDYDEAQVQKMFVRFPVLAPRPHANSAKRIDTLFLVVADLDEAVDFYRGLGLEVRKNKRIRYLGGRGAEVRYHGNTLALLQPDGPGLVADFVAERGEGILGLSVQVKNLQKARRYVNGHAGLNLQTIEENGRDRFLVPVSLTHGLLVEMVE
jgi:catechol 2,3-dioxygenase-like lactoylglutathione lyase family enzyme